MVFSFFLAGGVAADANPAHIATRNTEYFAGRFISAPREAASGLRGPLSALQSVVFPEPPPGRPGIRGGLPPAPALRLRPAPRDRRWLQARNAPGSGTSRCVPAAVRVRCVPV